MSITIKKPTTTSKRCYKDKLGHVFPNSPQGGILLLTTCDNYMLQLTPSTTLQQ